MSTQDVADGHTREQLKRLADFCEQVSSYSDELLLQLNRLTNNDKNRLQDMVTSVEWDAKHTQIAEATLFYESQIEKAIKHGFPSLRLPIANVPLLERLVEKTFGVYSNLTMAINGDSAVFFKAMENATDRRVMLRVFKQLPHEAEDDEVIPVDKYLKIKHRNIIKVQSAQLDQFPKYLAIEYINGISLDKLLRSDIPLVPVVALRIMENLATALCYLDNQGLVHGRVRPSKILIDNELQPVISPFEGYNASSHGQRSLRYMMQELQYLAPELVGGETTRHSALSDQFSYGLVGLEMLTGKSLFRDPDPSRDSLAQVVHRRRAFFDDPAAMLRAELAPLSLSEERIAMLVELFSTLLAHDPAQRYLDMGDVEDALSQIRWREDRTVSQARKSYNRCCINNPDFTDDFYAALLQHSAVAEYFTEYHRQLLLKNEKLNLEKMKRNRRKMLRTTIHLLLDDSQERVYTQTIKAMPQHRGMPVTFYTTYIDTLIGLIQDQDVRWNAALAKTWQEIRDRAVSRFTQTEPN